MMVDAPQPADSWRTGEYTAIVAEYSAHYARFQGSLGLLFTINTVFMTAIGALLFSARFNNWWAVIAIIFVGAFMTPFNIAWRRVVERFYQGTRVREHYLTEMEKTLPSNVRTVGAPYQQGLFLQLESKGLATQRGATEDLIYILFPYFYLVIAALTGVVTYLVGSGIIPKP